MNAPVIRSAKPSDLDQLIGLCEQHSLHEQVDYCSVGKKTQLNNLLFDNAPKLACLVVDSGSKLVGYATFAVQISTWLGDNYLHLDCLFLQKEFRGQGLGKSLMLRIQQEASLRNCGEVQWQTPLFNVDAIRFYDRLTHAVSYPKARFRWPIDTTPDFPSQ